MTLLSLFWIVVAIATFLSGAEKFVSKQFEYPILFRSKSIFTKPQTLSPELSIFSFDDSTFAKLGRPSPTLDEWFTILKNISLSKPRTVIIPKVFSDRPSQKEVTIFLSKIAELNLDITVGVFLVPGNIKGRKALDVDSPESPERSFFDFLSQDENSSDLHVTDLVTLDERWKIYGPSEGYLSSHAFRHLGHITSLNSDIDSFSPLVRLNSKSPLLIPHISLYAANKKEIIQGRLFLNEKLVPIQRNSLVQVNHLQPDIIFSNSQSLSQLLTQNTPSRYIKENSVVLILNEMFTGGTTFIETPFGPAPSPFSLVSNVNSILTKNWIQKFDFTIMLVVLAGMAGAALSLFASLPLFWGGFFAVILLLLIGEVALFSFFNILISFMLPALTFALTALTVFAYMARAKEKKLLLMRVIEAEKKRLEVEMKDAALIAKALLPDNIPSWPNFEIDVFHKPLTEASGDWFSFEKSASGKVFHFILCDITGHGVQGAIVASTCKTVLSLLSERTSSLMESQDFPARFGEQLNSTLFRQGHGTHVATLLVLTFIPEQHKLFFVSAGHPLPIFLDRSFNQKSLSKAAQKFDPPGFVAELPMNVSEISLEPGDQIIAFTDGLPLKSQSKLLKILGPSWHQELKTSKDIYKRAWQYEKEKNGRNPDDDVSMAWIKIT